MANYTKSTNFAVKDSLSTGNANKIIKGTEIDTEYNNIASAISSKGDSNNGSFTGTATMVNLTVSGTLNATVDGGTY
jgi:hypothetical protein